MKYNWESKNEPIVLWSIDFQEKYQDKSMEKNSFFNQWYCNNWIATCKRIKLYFHLNYMQN